MGRKTKTCNGQRKCNICCETKAVSEFYFNKKKLRPNACCKKCDCSRKRKYNYSSQRRSKLKSKYGITDIDFELMLEKQNGTCAICSCAAAKVVDHCHRTGVVRGLLCSPCNLMLGLANDNQKTLISALAYLSNEDAEKLEDAKFGKN